MPEQNQSLFSRYKKAIRSNPEAYVVVKDGDNWASSIDPYPRPSEAVDARI